MPKHNNLTESDLTPQQKQFAQEYLVDLNATQAAIRAGYSPKTARTQASQLLAKRNIQDLVYKYNQERLERTKIDADFVLKEHYKLATSDVAECFNDDGTMKDITAMPKNIRLAIASFKVQENLDKETGELTGYTKEVKLWSKDKNLENLGRHLKLYTDKKEISGSVELADKIKKARERSRS